MGFEEWVLGVVGSLVAGVTQSYAGYQKLRISKKTKIKGRVEDAVAEVVESVADFLEKEGLNDIQKSVLIKTCESELKPFVDKPAELFRSSLNGRIIFEQLYPDGKMPTAIREVGLSSVYGLLFLRVATLVCKVPEAIKDWESEAWSENYRRLDIIIKDLNELSDKVDGLTESKANDNDELLLTVRRFIAQKVGLELDFTGLRSSKAQTGKLEDFFVHPAFSRERPDKDEKELLNESKGCLERFIKSHNPTIIIGGPGSGKSTWTRWLKWRSTFDDWNGFVVRVELRRLKADNLPSIQALIRAEVGSHLSEELSAPHIRGWLDKGLVSFVFDGFDEVVINHRQKFLDWISEIRASIDKGAILITSRPLTSEHLDRNIEGWQSWMLEPFDHERIVEYIYRWHVHTTLSLDGNREVNVNELADTWQKDPVINPLTSNPLLLSTLLMVHHLDGRLPTGRSKLYERYIEGMLGIWDDRRNVESHEIFLTLLQKLEILRKLALHMHFEGVDSLEEEGANTLFSRICHELNLKFNPKDVLDLLQERSGLIDGPGVYNFVHKSIGEYLVAECIVQGNVRDANGVRLDRMELLEQRDDDRWNTITFLWAGMAPIIDVHAFIECCIELKCYELAFGILYDQYERFDPNCRNQFLLRLPDNGINWPSERDCYLSILSCGGRRANAGWVFSHWSLRSIGKECSLSQLICHAVEAGDIQVKDLYGFSGSLRTYIWLRLVKRSLDLESYKILLELELNCGQMKNKEYFFVESHLNWYLGVVESSHFQDTLDLFEQNKLFQKGFYHVAVMTLLSRDSFEELMSYCEGKQKVLNLLNGLLNWNHVLDSRSESIIRDTKNWCVKFGASEIDLIDEFVKTLNRFRESQLFESHSLYDELLDFAVGLRKVRDGYEQMNSVD